jgi:hypothetical protein
VFLFELHQKPNEELFEELFIEEKKRGKGRKK